MKYHYEIIEDFEAYRHFFHIRRYKLRHELFQGGQSPVIERECIHANKFVVVVLPFDPVRQELIFIEQFRVGAMVADVNPWQWEVVAGFMDKPEETPQESAQRELLEEIGTTAKSLTHVMTYLSSPGGSAAQNHLFFAQIDASETKAFAGLASEGEDICVHRVSYRQAKTFLAEGKFNNANTLVALQAFLLRQLHQ